MLLSSKSLKSVSTYETNITFTWKLNKLELNLTKLIKELLSFQFLAKSLRGLIQVLQNFQLINSPCRNLKIELTDTARANTIFSIIKNTEIYINIHKYSKGND